MIRPIRIANDVFSCVRKKDTSNQKPERCVSFAPKFPPFIGACRLQRRFADIQRKGFSRKKKLKTSRKLEWNSFVCFAVDEKKLQEPERENRMIRKLKLFFIGLLLY